MKRSFVRLLSLMLAIILLIGMLPVGLTFAEGSTTNYDDFLENLKVLEKYADVYASQTQRDPGELILNFIRTGVERYQDDNWTTLAGQEIVGFTSYVKAQDEEQGTSAMALRDLENFELPNDNEVDFGHMFGCMNISYINPGSADLSGWAGDLCDLLYYCVYDVSVSSGTVEEMAKYIGENCFGEDADNAFGWDDFYGDMDAYYLVSEYKKGNGSFSELMEAYFTSELSDTNRAVYFVNNRFGVEDSKEAVRKAVYEAYCADVGIKVLEAGRGLSSENNLREACCYAFADYLYSVAGGKDLLIPGSGNDTTVANGYYSVFSNEHSILAPGIEQDINYAQTVDGKQIVYYVATVDVTRDDVTIMANYKDNDPSKGWGLQTVEDQVKALVKNHAGEENFYPIVATNGDGYNITNGTPGGLLVMDGKEWHAVDGDGFFAILKDGSALIGTKEDYTAYKDQIQEAIGGFGAVLIKDGKINVTKSTSYTSQRASRTAIGIKEDGSVVMMVLDGRQLPRSAGGAMEEIAQIMLEAGCVQAINLDGGGSTTYLSKPAGSDDIQLVNVPSDGYQRSVSVSLVAVSTAAPSTAFDHAIISSDYEYITAGTSMQFGVTGVSNTGNAADIPDGSYWKTSNESIGAIDKDTGVFTAVSNGDVTVEYIVDGKVAGSKEIHVVIPDDIKFAEDRITAIYGVPKEIEVTVWYKGSPVAFTPLVDMGIFFPGTVDDDGNVELLFESDAGIIEGVTFTGSDSKGIRTATIIAALQAGEDIVVKYAKINLYYADEATFDFANATQGNRKLAWNREIENAKSTDNMLYRISDPTRPVEIEYTFALDMTTIDIPAQLEPLKGMLPTYQADATAWTYLLQLAERVCTKTNVTIKAEFSKDLEVDISGLKVVNDYFTLTNAILDENNVLTVVCNWNNQSQPIDAATANPLCILTGLKATVKNTAGYYNNEITIANNGDVSYDIYLAASSLYSFAQNTGNQADYGLYPYIHEDDCRGDFSDAIGDEATVENNDKGAHFSSQYIDFADIYVINNEIRQGWHQEGNDYYYYVDNVALTGVQLVTDRKDFTQKRFYEFDETGKLVSEQGTTGLIPFEGDLYYAVLGVAQTGWQQIDGNNYYFHPDTGKAVDGVQTLKERIFPNTDDLNTASYTYTFENYILIRGDLRKDNIYGNTGWRYRWAGDWVKGCWFEVDGNTYHVEKNYPYILTTGYGYYIHDFINGTDSTGCYLFDENGVLQKDYIGPKYVTWTSGNTQKSGTLFFKNGVLYTTAGLIQGTDGYYYFVKTSADGTIVQNSTQWVGVAQSGADWTNGLVTAGTYSFDAQGRLYDPPILTVTDTHNIGYTAIGRVVTITNSQAVKVGYLKNGEYVAIEATKNADGNYNFAVPQDVGEVTAVITGDVNGDGKVDATDNNVLAASLMPNATDLTGLSLFAADVNGNGKLNSADMTLIARSLLAPEHDLYQPLAW